jgi:hypothetical protein
MKPFINLFISFIILHSFLFAQPFPESHIPATHDHNHTSICHGYAMGRAMGKTTGDAFCDPVTTYNNQIDPAYFTFVPDPNLSEILPGDIVSWGSNSHSAYVVYVPNPLNNIGNIRVDQVPNPGGQEQKNILLSSVMNIHGNPSGYYLGNHGLKIRFTFRNSFENGILNYKQSTKIVWQTVNHGMSKLFQGGIILNMKAIDNQEFPTGYLQRYRRWQRDLTIIGTNNPISEIVEFSRTFTANFSREFNVEFRNNFDGSGGGQIKVDDVPKNAPYVAKVLEENPSVKAEAINGQYINGFLYNFDRWQDDVKTNPRTFFVSNHETFTSYFKKALYVQIDGPTSLEIDEFGTFTAIPGGGSSAYINYRWWKRNDSGGMNSQIAPLAPPPGEWIYMSIWVGQQTVITGAAYNFSLKCEVTDSDNNIATDIHSVMVGGQFFSKENQKNIATLKFIPTELSLYVNYPNPFNPTTTIRFGLPEAQRVFISIYSITGENVINLVDDYLSEGYHNVVWNGINQSGNKVASGVYIYEMRAKNKHFIRKMLFAK